MHGNEQPRVGILFGDEANRAIPHCKIIREIDLLESRILTDKLDRERARLALPRNLRRRIAFGPTIVVARDSTQDVFPRLRRRKKIVAPALGKRSRQARMVGMRDELPTGFGFKTQHVRSPRKIHKFEISNLRFEIRLSRDSVSSFHCVTLLPERVPIRASDVENTILKT